MSVYCALIVNIGCQHTLDGDLMRLVDHGCEPLYVGHAAQFIEAISIGREVVLHERAADGAPAIDVVVLGSGRRIAVAIGHIAYRNACTVHFAYGIDLCMTIGEGHRNVVFAQRLIPVDGALVAVGLEAEFAAAHLVVGDVGAAAWCRSRISILLEAVAVGEGSTVCGVAPREGVHRFCFLDGDAVGVGNRLSACHPSHEAVVVALIALHLDGGDAIAEGGVA